MKLSYQYNSEKNKDFELHYLTCKKCGHKWIPKVKNPVKFPNIDCQSYKWNQSMKEFLMEYYHIDEKELEEELKKIINNKEKIIGGNV